MDFILSPIVINYDSDESRCKTILIDYYNNEDIIFYLLSGNDECKNNIIPYLKLANRIAFFISTSDGEDCSKYIFYTGVNPSHLLPTVCSWHTVYPEYYYIFVISELNRFYSVLYDEMYRRHLKTTILLTYDNDDEIEKQANDIIKGYKCKISIITNYNLEKLTLFSNYFYNYYLNNPDLIYLIFVPTPVYRQIYIFNTSNIYTVGNMAYNTEEFVKFSNEIINLIGNNTYISSGSISLYTSIMLAAEALPNIDDFSAENFASKLYGVYYNGPGGNWSILENHQVRKNVYLYRIENNEIKIYREYIDYRPNVFLKGGLYEFGNHDCDWKNFPDNGDKLEYLPIYPIGVVNINYGPEILKNTLIYEVISSLHKYYGITERDSPFFQVIYTKNSYNEEELFNNVKDFINEYKNVTFLIGGARPYEREIIVRAINNTDIILIYPGYSEGYYCYKNVITTGLLVQTSEQLYIRNIQLFPTNLIILWCGNSEESSSLINDLVYISNMYSLNFMKLIYLEVDNYAKLIDSLSQTWSSINSLCLDQECLIINTIPYYTTEIILYYYNKGILYKDSNYYLLSFFLSIGVISSIQYENLEQAYFISSYPYIYDSTVLGKNIIVDNFQAIENYILSVLKIDETKSNVAYGCISALGLITTAIRRSHIYHGSLLSLIHDVSFKGAGEVKLYPNNFCSSTIYIFKANGINSLSIFSYSKNIIRPDPWSVYSGDYRGIMCTWDKDDEYNIINNPYIQITIIEEINILFINVSRTITTIMLSFIDLQNEEELTGGYIIEPFVITFTESIAQNDIKNGIVDEHVQMIIGCFSYKCKTYVEHYTERYEKLFIYIGWNEVYSCSPYTIKINENPIHCTRIATQYFSKYKYAFGLFEEGNNGIILENATRKIIQQNYTEYYSLFISLDSNNNIDKLKEYLNENNDVIIFSYLTNYYLIKVIDELGNDYKNSYTFIFFFFAPLAYTDKYMDHMINHYFFTSYTSDYNSFYHSGVKKYVDDIVSRSVNRFIESEYISLNMFIDAFNMALKYQKSSDYPSIDLLIATFLKTTFSSYSCIFIIL